MEEKIKNRNYEKNFNKYLWNQYDALHERLSRKISSLSKILNSFIDIYHVKKEYYKNLRPLIKDEPPALIEEESFQIGEHFDNDIEHAPILFLSSNPAFTFDEVSPRYFPASGKIFIPEHIDTAKKAEFSAGEYSLEEIKKKLTVPQKEMTFEEIGVASEITPNFFCHQL